MIKVTPHANQTLYDVAMQYFGSVAGVQRIRNANPFITSITWVFSGTEQITITGGVINSDVRNYFNQAITPANANAIALLQADDFSPDFNTDFTR
jgi:hypothetical protein